MSSVFRRRNQMPLFKTITVKFWDALKKAPEIQSLHSVVDLVLLEHGKKGLKIPVIDNDAMGNPVKQGGVSVLQNGCHLGVDGAEDKETALVCISKLIDPFL